MQQIPIYCTSSSWYDRYYNIIAVLWYADEKNMAKIASITNNKNRTANSAMASAAVLGPVQGRVCPTTTTTTTTATKTAPIFRAFAIVSVLIATASIAVFDVTSVATTIATTVRQKFASSSAAATTALATTTEDAPSAKALGGSSDTVKITATASEGETATEPGVTDALAAAETPDAEIGFQLALKRASARRGVIGDGSGGGVNNATSSALLAGNLKEYYRGAYNEFVLNLIRVPKAGSSAVSVIARAIAGCLPDVSDVSLARQRLSA